MNRVICIAPHADDEILGCGATIAKHVEQSDEVFVIIATNASVGAPELFSRDSINETRLEALNAHKFLGIEKTFFFRISCPCFECISRV